jgi:DNA-binding CsgD family transcriptional regulator
MERLQGLNRGIERQDTFQNANDMEYLKSLNEGEQLRRQIEGQLGLAKEKQTLENESPLATAQTGYYQGLGEKARTEADFNRSLVGGQTPGTAAPAGAAPNGPSPEDIAAGRARLAAERSKAGVAAPQEALSLEQQIQKWLAEGKTPEDIKLLLNPGPNTSRQNRVQDRLILQDANAAATQQQQQQTIQEIMRAAGLLSQPNTRRDLSSVY